MGASPSPTGGIDFKNWSGPLLDNSSRSYPAQNESPFPYNTATVHSSSISKFRNASASCFAVSELTALRFSGRAIETRNIFPSCSVSTKVLFNLLDEATKEGILRACSRARRAKRESAILLQNTSYLHTPEIPGTREFLEQLLSNQIVRFWVFEKTWRPGISCIAPIYFHREKNVQKRLYPLKNECEWGKEMTSAKEGQSDGSSSGEDEESLRELVSWNLCASEVCISAFLKRVVYVV